MVTGAGDLFAGRYELGASLGAGGTGVVRQARDTVLDRPVALKLLRGGAGDEVVRARLRMEAQLAGSLVHPGIAQVYDFGEDESDGEPTPYIVMEYVEGTSLWHLLRERRTLPVQQVMNLVAQVAAALQVAHDAGIVHRDLKPSNVLVTPEGRAVLVDFGIARTTDTDPLTMTGAIVGTVDYLSPEQGAGRSATTASDVYSLGMVAYECLSGHKPFHRESLIATALAHVQDEAPELDRSVPEPVRALVAQMIAKEPADRPAPVGEVSRRAAALAADPHRPVALRRPSRVRPAAVLTAGIRHALGSRRVQAGATAVAVAVALTGTVAARSSAPRMPDVEGRSFAQARAALEHRGVEAERVPVDGSAAARGTVLDQEPAPGRSVEGGTALLEVSSGMAVLDPQAVTGLRYREAARVLVSLGLVPSRRVAERPGGDGTVVTALPAGRLPVGTTVRLTVGVEPAEPTAAMSRAPAGPGAGGR